MTPNCKSLEASNLRHGLQVLIGAGWPVNVKNGSPTPNLTRLAVALAFLAPFHTAVIRAREGKNRRTRSDSKKTGATKCLFLPVLLQGLRRNFPGVDIALRVGGDALRAGIVVLVRIRLVVGNERRHLPVFRAADPDAACVAGVLLGVRLRIDDIQRVALVDEHAARSAELLPLIDEAPV